MPWCEGVECACCLPGELVSFPQMGERPEHFNSQRTILWKQVYKSLFLKEIESLWSLVIQFNLREKSLKRLLQEIHPCLAQKLFWFISLIKLPSLSSAFNPSWFLYEGFRSTFCFHHTVTTKQIRVGWVFFFPFFLILAPYLQARIIWMSSSESL